MNISELLKFADHLVFTETGKHLNNLQKDVLQGVWEDKDYSTIADTVERDEQYIRNIASELWQVLSQNIGEKVNKANLKSAIERQIIISSQNINNNYVGVGNLHICRDRHSENTSISETETSESCKDLTTAPIVNQFYGRTAELHLLEEYMFDNQTQLVTLFGVNGIGKSLLFKQFVDLHSDKFEIIIWKKLQFKPDLDDFLKSILKFIDSRYNLVECWEQKISRLMKILSEKRCLIIIDDLQCLLTTGELSGHYQSKYKSYKTLFKAIADISHQSCFVLISQEKPKEVAQLEKDNPSVYSLQLQGLDESAAMELFRNKALQDEARCLKLINLYQGHPQWLKWIADLIQELGNGNVSEIFSDDSILLVEDIQDCLNQIFSRLSDREKQILLALAQCNQSVSILQLKDAVTLSQVELIDALRSLLRRCLIEIEEKPDRRYCLNRLMRLYFI